MAINDGTDYTPPTPSTQSFTNTSTVKPSNPTGIPDPNNPGYDTAGYLLGSTRDASGNLHVPNPTTGQTANTPAGTINTTSSPTNPTSSSPQSYTDLANSLFGAQPTIPNVPAFNYAAFQAPAPFSAPSGQDVLNADPGYQFRLTQGSGALQNSAAARGVLNTGGTLQDLLNYGQNAASQEYQGAYDRSLGTYQTNFSDALNSWLANAGNALTNYNTNYQTQYQNPYLAAVGQYQQRVGNQGQIFGQQLATATS